MLLRDHRIAKFVVLVVVLDDRAGQRGSLFHTEPLGQRACHDVAHDHFHRDDLDLFDELLAHIEAAHKVGGNADIVKPRHQMFGNPIVDDTFTVNCAFFLIVEGGGIVFEIRDQRAGLRALEKHLGFTLVDLSAAGHGIDPQYKRTCTGVGLGVHNGVRQHSGIGEP